MKITPEPSGRNVIPRQQLTCPPHRPPPRPFVRKGRLSGTLIARASRGRSCPSRASRRALWRVACWLPRPSSAGARRAARHALSACKKRCSRRLRPIRASISSGSSSKWRATYEAAQKQGGFLQIPGKMLGGAAPAAKRASPSDLRPAAHNRLIAGSNPATPPSHSCESGAPPRVGGRLRRCGTGTCEPEAEVILVHKL